MNYENKHWWKKLLGLKQTCGLLLFFIIFFHFASNAQCFDMKELLPIKHNVFIKGPKMHVYHNGPAVLMNDGNVLVIGGDTKKAEIYDYKKNKFIYTKEEMKNKRVFGATGTLLRNGNILIAGGGERKIKKIGNNYAPQDPIIVNNAEIYDIRVKRFIEIGNMSVPRAAHTALETQNGNILFFGGYDKNKKNVLEIEEYNIDTNTFKVINKFQDENYLYQSCVKIENNKFIIIAIPKGFLEKRRKPNKIFIYDYNANKINEYKEQNPQITACKIYTTSISIDNPYGDGSKNFILFVNSNDKNEIQIIAVQNSKIGYTVNNINKNTALLIGGNIFDGWGGRTSNESILYNQGNEQSKGPKLNKKRYKHIAINLKDNKILIIGGYSIPQVDDDSSILTSEIYYK